MILLLLTEPPARREQAADQSKFTGPNCTEGQLATNYLNINKLRDLR